MLQIVLENRQPTDRCDYFRDLIGQRRASPRDDLVSALVAADEQHDTTSEEELIATTILLLFAGHETTTNLIGNGILSLLRHPAELQALLADPSLIVPAVEELLRYEGPTAAMVRIALEGIPLPIGGTIGRRDRVFLMINATNHASVASAPHLPKLGDTYITLPAAVASGTSSNLPVLTS